MDQPKSYILYMREMVGDKKFLLTAACVVLADEKGRVLLQERADSKKWGLPGGLMELDEPIADCAVREVFEETGLHVRLTGFLGVFNNPLMRWRVKDEARVLAFAFTGEVVGGTLSVHDDESLRFDWFDKDHLPTLHSVDTAEILDAFFQGKRNLVEGRNYQ
jgi:8-oxo-dGTP pyrophosphatase MutT (NUDIX family)